VVNKNTGAGKNRPLYTMFLEGESYRIKTFKAQEFIDITDIIKEEVRKNSVDEVIADQEYFY